MKILMDDKLKHRLVGLLLYYRWALYFSLQ